MMLGGYLADRAVVSKATRRRTAGYVDGQNKRR
jgi:hypothetical protein